jgi:hypothetical protein
LRLGLGPALRTHLPACLLGAGRGRRGSGGSRGRRGLGSRWRRRGLGSRWSFLRVSGPEAEANDESDDDEAFHWRDFLDLKRLASARAKR